MATPVLKYINFLIFSNIWTRTGTMIADRIERSKDRPFFVIADRDRTRPNFGRSFFDPFNQLQFNIYYSNDHWSDRKIDLIFMITDYRPYLLDRWSDRKSINYYWSDRWSDRKKFYDRPSSNLDHDQIVYRFIPKEKYLELIYN